MQILQKFGVPDRTTSYEWEWNNAWSGSGVPKRASEVNRELLRWIDDKEGQDRPFFAFLNYFDVHMPYGGPLGYQKTAWPEKESAGQYVAQRIDQYDDSIKYVDDSIRNCSYS
jgi:arylsulfatase A-like enzyme